MKGTKQLSITVINNNNFTGVLTIIVVCNIHSSEPHCGP